MDDQVAKHMLDKSTIDPLRFCAYSYQQNELSKFTSGISSEQIVILPAYMFALGRRAFLAILANPKKM